MKNKFILILLLVFLVACTTKKTVSVNYYQDLDIFTLQGIRQIHKDSLRYPCVALWKNTDTLFVSILYTNWDNLNNAKKIRFIKQGNGLRYRGFSVTKLHEYRSIETDYIFVYADSVIKFHYSRDYLNGAKKAKTKLSYLSIYKKELAKQVYIKQIYDTTLVENKIVPFLNKTNTYRTVMAWHRYSNDTLWLKHYITNQTVVDTAWSAYYSIYGKDYNRSYFWNIYLGKTEPYPEPLPIGSDTTNIDEE